MSSVGARARIAQGETARVLAGHAHTLVGGLADQDAARERIRAWRVARVLALEGLDRSVLEALAAGVTWGQLAEDLGRAVEDVRAIYQAAYDVWASADLDPDLAVTEDGPGSTPATADAFDLACTAAALDAWWQQHASPGQERAHRPASGALDAQ